VAGELGAVADAGDTCNQAPPAGVVTEAAAVKPSGWPLLPIRIFCEPGSGPSIG
jgi:hypothetical protein